MNLLSYGAKLSKYFRNSAQTTFGLSSVAYYVPRMFQTLAFRQRDQIGPIRRHFGYFLPNQFSPKQAVSTIGVSELQK
jgi:hypothetical protein